MYGIRCPSVYQSNSRLILGKFGALELKFRFKNEPILGIFSRFEAKHTPAYKSFGRQAMYHFFRISHL